MKKIFTLIAATFAAISINAQGTTLIEYTCSGPVSADGDDNNYATVASNDNGKIVIGQYDKVCADIAVKEGNTSLPAKPGVMLDGNPSETTTKYVRISLKEPFQAGDVITAKGTTKKSSGNGVVLCQTKANGEGSTIYIDFPRYEETEGSYTVQDGDVLCGGTELYMMRRSGDTCYLMAVSVTRGGTNVGAVVTDKKQKTAVKTLKGISKNGKAFNYAGAQTK